MTSDLAAETARADRAEAKLAAMALRLREVLASGDEALGPETWDVCPKCGGRAAWADSGDCAACYPEPGGYMERAIHATRELGTAPETNHERSHRLDREARAGVPVCGRCMSAACPGRNDSDKCERLRG